VGGRVGGVVGGADSTQSPLNFGPEPLWIDNVDPIDMGLQEYRSPDVEMVDTCSEHSVDTALTSSQRHDVCSSKSTPSARSHRSTQITTPSSRSEAVTPSSASIEETFDYRPQVVEGTPRTSDEEQPMEEHDNLSATGLLIASHEWRNSVREDYIVFLKENLLRWKQDGLWHQTPLLSPSKDRSGSGSLESVYHCVCQLEMRMDDDPIRKRVALILLHLEFENISRKWRAQSRNERKYQTGIGQGYSTLMIDNILMNIHANWTTSSSRRKSELRAKFHNRKRYGKRWSVLTASLGSGILFVCSKALARMMYGCLIARVLISDTDHLIEELLPLLNKDFKQLRRTSTLQNMFYVFLV
jgi:hypothetical protein